MKTRIGDGYRGWPQAAPFDAILVTAAPPRIPEPLKQQLAVGGRLVVPVGEDEQELLVLTRTKTGFEERRVLPVRFVPMTGEAQKPQPQLAGQMIQCGTLKGSHAPRDGLRAAKPRYARRE